MPVRFHAEALRDLIQSLEDSASALHAVADAVEQRPAWERDLPPLGMPTVQAAWKRYLPSMIAANKLARDAERWLPSCWPAGFTSHYGEPLAWAMTLSDLTALGMGKGPNEISVKELTQAAVLILERTAVLARLSRSTVPNARSGPDAAEAALLELARRQVRENGRTLTAAEICDELRPLSLLDFWTAAVLKLEARGVLIPKEHPLPTGNRPGDAIKRSFLRRSGPSLWLIGAGVVDEPATVPAAAPPTPPAGTERSEGGNSVRGRRNRIPKDETESRIRDWLKKHAIENPASITRDAVADGTKLGAGTVSNSDAWKAFRDRRNAEAKSVARSVPLSATLQAAIPADCASPDELAALIEEQEAEQAEESRRHKRRHEPS